MQIKRQSEGYGHDCIATQQGSRTTKAESWLQYVTVTHPLVTERLTHQKDIITYILIE